MNKQEKFIEHIVAFTCEEVNAFLVEHPDEEFYAFAYDCNPQTKGIYLSFNTINAFKETLYQYQNSEYSDLYNSKNQINRLKFNPGDWKYHNFVYIEFIYDDKLKELFDVVLDPNTNNLMNFAERALLDFKRTAVYQSIPKTVDFISFCIDQEEDELKAIQRSIRIN